MFEDLQDLYNANIVDRGRRPQHMRRLEAFDATAKGDNPMCGDRVQVWLKYAPDGAIAEASFEARGCEISRASADLMVEAVAGRAPADTRRLFEAFRTMVQTGDCPACDAATIERSGNAAPLGQRSRVSLPGEMRDTALARFARRAGRWGARQQ